MQADMLRYLKQGHRAVSDADYDAACDAFEKAADAAPDDVRPRFQLAQAQARRGDYGAAWKTANAALERFPDSAFVRLLAGRCFLECGDAKNAAPLLESAARALPENPVARQYLALCRLMSGGGEAAADALGRARFFGSADYLALLSHEIERRLLARKPATDREAPPVSEEVAAWIARLEERANLNPDSSRSGKAARKNAARKLATRGETEYDRGNYAVALALFEAVGRLAPDMAIAHLGAGLSALRLDRPDHAAQRLSEALRLQPGDGIVGASYGDTLYRCGRYEEALAVFEKVEPVGPDDFHAHYGRGACLAALGRKREALEQFRIGFEQYRLEAVDDCLKPAWEEFCRRSRDDGTVEPTSLTPGEVLERD